MLAGPQLCKKDNPAQRVAQYPSCVTKYCVYKAERVLLLKIVFCNSDFVSCKNCTGPNLILINLFCE